MKTSFHEIIETEKYLRAELAPEESVVFQAKLLLDHDLKKNTFFHTKAHRMILLYRRKKMKAELQSIHDRLFRDPEKTSFRKKILQLFNF